jgi:type VI secretion system protein VasD
MRTLAPSAVAAVLLLPVVVAGCAKPPAVAAPPPITIVAPAEAKVTAAMTIRASADANPDRTGRPSPVVVRIYQLRTDAAFNTASFTELFENEEQVLGAELITRDEYVLAPQDSRTINVTIAGETRFVGAIAGFRDILNAQWRGLVPAPKMGLTVAVERTRLVMSPVN